jgi:LytS/YehU family sensor histidine kinase
MTASIPSLDAALPAELIGREHGWFTRYRSFPVFSPAWARGRLRSSMIIVGLFFALVIPVVLSSAQAERTWGALFALLVWLSLPLVAGPWLGVRVRRQAWPAAREGAMLAAAVLAVTVGSLLFDHFAAEPIKQFIAERTGALDPKGKRQKVVMSIGINVSTPEEAASAANRSQEDSENDSVSTAINLVSKATVTFLLAGGLGLRGWQRERRGLEALRQERALAEAQAQRREAELRLSVLAAQVEPHFLFNTLAGVRSAIATDPARASDMIDRLVEYLRAAIPRLRSDGTAQATVGVQFEIVRAYLGLMAARMSRLGFSLQAEPDLLKANCPPLMLISLAENAVKHGVEMKVGPVQVDVRAERTADGRLALTVEDDGAGFGASQSGSGLGLSNIRERLQQLHGERAALELRSRAGGGVSATITVPLELSA